MGTQSSTSGQAVSIIQKTGEYIMQQTSFPIPVPVGRSEMKPTSTRTGKLFILHLYDYLDQVPTHMH